MRISKSNILKLENQLCFPLYAASKELVKKYRPYLDKFNLTYTQYITMLVLLEKKRISVKELGEILYLDSGTLSPLLKALAEKGLVERYRSKEDERVVIAVVTEEGEQLKKHLAVIPHEVGKGLPLDEEEKQTLHKLLAKLLDSVE